MLSHSRLLLGLVPPTVLQVFIAIGDEIEIYFILNVNF